jgi:protein SCO1/2/putative membrane protein
VVSGVNHNSIGLVERQRFVSLQIADFRLQIENNAPEPGSANLQSAICNLQSIFGATRRSPLTAYLFLAALLCLCSSCSRPEADSLSIDLDQPIGAFSLTERSGRIITLDDLRGKVWVAHFFFRCCTQGCPQTTASMVELQRAFAGNPRVMLVSFTLDPETDTPEELKTFAAEHGADPKQWLFLTGDEKTIHTLVEKSFLQSVAKTGDPDPGKKILHTFRLMVVDGDGRIRGYIDDGRDPEQVGNLEKRVRTLANILVRNLEKQTLADLQGLRTFLPGLNASLNVTCAVLLVLVFLAIRRRRENLHKACMLSALAVSLVFLASYLFYHLVLHGRATAFQGEGWIRPVYFTVLLTHTVLAAVVAPLALFTAWQGIRERRPRHVRIARWTLPLWLYVSITGVVVYWMLYHLYSPY